MYSVGKICQRRLFSLISTKTKDYYKELGALNYEFKRSSERTSGKNSIPDVSPSYFTGRPILFDTMTTFDDYIEKYGKELQNSPTHDLLGKEIALPKWLGNYELSSLWQIRIEKEEYNDLVDKLNKLAMITRVIKDPKLDDIVKKFSLTNTQEKTGEINTVLDKWGRAYAVGFRRRVKCHVWTTMAKESGTGQVVIDGVNFVDYFPRFCDREKIVFPFEVTDSIGKYNVWIETETSVDGAGGKSSISDAAANGIANSLLIFDPGLERWLSEVNLIEPDLRQRERKKPGQPSARANFQWVKR